MKSATRGNCNDVWSSPIVLTLSKGKRHGAKARADATNEAGEGKEGARPGLFDGGVGSVVAEW